MHNADQDRDGRSERARRSAQTPRAPRPPVDHSRGDSVMTIPEWCALNRFSVATGHRILRRGDGPATVQLSTRRIGIRVSDNRAWQNARLRDAS